MKKMLMIGSLFVNLSAYAGGMDDIPVQLLGVENQGRIEFIQNALVQTGLNSAQNVKYSHFETIVIGGDEEGSDYTGGYFIYIAQLKSQDGKSYKCHQYLSVGNFNPNLTRPVVCESLVF